MRRQGGARETWPPSNVYLDVRLHYGSHWMAEYGVLWQCVSDRSYGYADNLRVSTIAHNKKLCNILSVTLLSLSAVFPYIKHQRSRSCNNFSRDDILLINSHDLRQTETKRHKYFSSQWRFSKRNPWASEYEYSEKVVSSHTLFHRGTQFFYRTCRTE